MCIEIVLPSLPFTSLSLSLQICISSSPSKTAFSFSPLGLCACPRFSLFPSPISLFSTPTNSRERREMILRLFEAAASERRREGGTSQPLGSTYAEEAFPRNQSGPPSPVHTHTPYALFSPLHARGDVYSHLFVRDLSPATSVQSRAEHAPPPSPPSFPRGDERETLNSNGIVCGGVGWGANIEGRDIRKKLDLRSKSNSLMCKHYFHMCRGLFTPLRYLRSAMMMGAIAVTLCVQVSPFGDYHTHVYMWPTQSPVCVFRASVGDQLHTETWTGARGRERERESSLWLMTPRPY